MDSKIITRLFFLIDIFFPTNLIAIEFKGKFLQGHYIVGITDPSSQIMIDKKKVKLELIALASPILPFSFLILL